MPCPRIFAALTLVLISAQALAIGRHNESITSASAYTEYAENFPSVGGLFLDLDEGGGSFASGVLIHPNFVLTSGHGVLTNDNNPTSFFDDFLFVLGPNTSTLAAEFQYADQVILSPDYDGVERGADIALLFFETPFVSAVPAQFYPEIVGFGDIATIVGYGASGTPRTDIQPPDGVRRASQNVIDAVDSRDFGYFGHRFRNIGHPDFLSLGGQGLPGDSGGGWFLERDGEYQLAGITSGGGQETGHGIDTSAYAIYRSTDWIVSTIASTSPSIPGDYDQNGTVEAADYAIWEATYGDYGVALAADGNLDGRVDAADYSVWRDALAAGALAVPEPSAAWLLLSLCVCGWRAR